MSFGQKLVSNRAVGRNEQFASNQDKQGVLEPVKAWWFAVSGHPSYAFDTTTEQLPQWILFALLLMSGQYLNANAEGFNYRHVDMNGF